MYAVLVTYYSTVVLVLHHLQSQAQAAAARNLPGRLDCKLTILVLHDVGWTMIAECLMSLNGA